MTTRSPLRCYACEAQDAIATSPHEPGCRCYAAAYLMGYIEAVAASSGTYVRPTFCGRCMAIMTEEIRRLGLDVVKIEQATPPREKMS